MDDQLQAENIGVPQDVETSPVSEEVVEESPARDTQDQDAQEGTPEQKPTRAERRIRELSGRAKALQEENEKLKGYGIPPQREPLFKPGEDQVDPVEFENRINGLVERKLAEKEAHRTLIENQTRVYDEHSKDFEEVLAKHPEFDSSAGGNKVLEDQFVNLFNRLNTVKDASGRDVYVPKVKASEIVAMIEGVKSALHVDETSQITGKILKQANEQMPAGGGDRVERGNYELDDIKNAAISSGSVETWADYFKKSGLAKPRE